MRANKWDELFKAEVQIMRPHWDKALLCAISKQRNTESRTALMVEHFAPILPLAGVDAPKALACAAAPDEAQGAHVADLESLCVASQSGDLLFRAKRKVAVRALVDERSEKILAAVLAAPVTPSAVAKAKAEFEDAVQELAVEGSRTKFLGVVLYRGVKVGIKVPTEFESVLKCRRRKKLQ